MSKMRTKSMKSMKKQAPISEREALLTKSIPLSARAKYRVIPPSFIEMRKKEIEELKEKQIEGIKSKRAKA